MATPQATPAAALHFDLRADSVRELNRRLHSGEPAGRVHVANPDGRHSIAVGLDAPYEVEIDGHVGYYCAGMNQQATVRVHGNCGVGVAENMMSGAVIVDGSASQAAGATARGGLLVIHGDASARCGISLKGADVVVRGSIGHMGAFMGQKAAWSSAVTPARPSATRCTKHGCSCAVRSPGSAPTAWRRRCATSTGCSCADCSPPLRSTPTRRDSGGTARRGRSTTSPSTTSGSTDAMATTNRSRTADGRGWHPGLRESATFDRDTIAEIQRAAREGIYDIRGFGAKRRVPHFDDLLFLGASVSRYPLEGYRERCATDVTIGTRFASEPIHWTSRSRSPA